MTRFLLDTNMISDLVRDPRGRVNRRIQQVGSTAVLTSIMVAGESLYGIAKSGSGRMGKQLKIVLQSMEVAPFEHPAELRYAELRASHWARGTPIGANDLLIAAHALALGCVLVTANEREFGRVDGLAVENWLA